MAMSIALLPFNFAIIGGGSRRAQVTPKWLSQICFTLKRKVSQICLTYLETKSRKVCVEIQAWLANQSAQHYRTKLSCQENNQETQGLYSYKQAWHTFSTRAM